jgi:hypothetical protein
VQLEVTSNRPQPGSDTGRVCPLCRRDPQGPGDRSDSTAPQDRTWAQDVLCNENDKDGDSEVASEVSSAVLTVICAS